MNSKKTSKNMKVALVYDRVNKWGGAERVLLALKKIFPDAPLYTSVYDKKGAPWAKDFDVVPSFLQKLPIKKTSHEYLAPLMPLAFETQSFDEYDILISVTSESAKGVLTKPSTKHICICLTPTRYLWSGYDEYFTNQLLRLVAKPFIWYLRTWDIMASKRPDAYAAISKTVKARVKKTYNRDADVIYPPINIKSKTKKKSKDYFLVVARLVKYKRVDLAIKAANKLRVPLVVVGDGRQKKYLESIAGETVTFKNNVSEDELESLYTNAKALVFPGLEDLGLAMIEAQACGTPVIAYKKGGAVELVVEGKTGEFFNQQNTDSLASVMEKFREGRYNSKSCIKFAEKFSFENFKEELLELISKT